MNDLILVDTSIWINYFRGEAETVQQLDRIIDQGLVLVSGLILQEVLQGSRDRKAFERLREEMQIWAYEKEVPEDFIEAARLFAELRWKGDTVPPSDCLVASVALRRQIRLFARDSHFERIGELGPTRAKRLRLML